MLVEMLMSLSAGGPGRDREEEEDGLGGFESDGSSASDPAPVSAPVAGAAVGGMANSVGSSSGWGGGEDFAGFVCCVFVSAEAAIRSCSLRFRLSFTSSERLLAGVKEKAENIIPELN